MRWVDVLDCLYLSFSFRFRNEFPSLLTISNFSKINQKFQNAKNKLIPCPFVCRFRLIDGHGTRCCVPRYLRCSYSVGNSISVNLIINYPVNAFVGRLSEIVGEALLVVGEGEEGNRLLHEESETIEKWKRMICRWMKGNSLARNDC